MAVLFAGHELDSFTSYTPGMFSMTSSTGYYDSDFSRSALLSTLSATRTNCARIDIPPTAEGWIQFRWRSSNTAVTAPNNVVVAYTADDASALFDLNGTLTSFQTRGATSDSARTAISPSMSIGTSETAVITVHWKAVAGGMLLELFKNGVLISTATISNAYLSGKTVGILRIGGEAYSTSTTYVRGISELVVADEDPRGWRVATLAPNASGSASEWSGGFADVNQAAVDDGTFISTELAEKTQLMALSNLSVSAQNLDVKAVSLGGRARKGSIGPQNLQAALRTNATTVLTPNLEPLGVEFGNLPQTVWQNNPVTGVKFTIPEIQGLEAGFKSKA